MQNWNTPQIAYRVDVCPRGNLPYMRIYPINNTNIFKDIEAWFIEEIPEILKVIFEVTLRTC